jgi:opacity protein-like surface antigen
MVGFGTELALASPWTAKGEFDWLDFGTKPLALSDGTIVSSSSASPRARSASTTSSYRDHWAGLKYFVLPMQRWTVEERVRLTGGALL